MTLSDPAAVWARLRESLWFVPTLIVLTALLLAVGMVELSTQVDDQALAQWPRIFGVGADGSRSMLSAIAGSMITVAGVTFSITMVAVTQASAQYSPRILRNFMRDRANQAVLGVFVGIFAYCLVVLRTIRGGEESAFVPSVAVLVGVLLALVGIAVLIFFVHHIATTLQASEIISRISTDTCEVMDRLFPEQLGEAVPVVSPPDESLPGSEVWRSIPSPSTGYIQRANIGRLVQVADDYDLLIRLHQAVGAFALSGRPIAAFVRQPSAPAGGTSVASKASDPVEELSRQFVVSTYRSLDQDPGFGIRQLVDIALKALSPGINDTTTAVTCIDYLGALLVRVAARRVDLEHRGRAGRVRVVSPGPTFENLLDLAVDEIRQHATGNVSVLGRLLEMLSAVGQAARGTSRRQSVARQIALVETAVAGVAAEHDRERLAALAGRALAAASSAGG